MWFKARSVGLRLFGQTTRCKATARPNALSSDFLKRMIENRYYIMMGTTFVTATGLMLFYYGEKDRYFDKITKQSNQVESVGKASVGGPFSLVTENGQKVTENDFKGVFKIFYFGFTNCPDICPDELDKLGLIMDKIGNDDEIKGMVYPLFVSVDAKRDSVAAVKEYLTDFHPTILGLTGSEEQVKDMAKKYRVYFSPAATMPASSGSQDYLLDHTVYFYLMDPNGEFIDVFGRECTSSETYLKIYEYIKKYIAENGSDNIKRFKDPKQLPL